MKHGAKLERNNEIVRRVLNGDTLKAVGDTYGITSPRVRQIFYATMYRMFKNEHHLRESWRKIKKINLKSWRVSKNYILARLI